MNSLRASVSRPRTSSFCAIELSALLQKPVPGGATTLDRNNSLPLSLFLQAERQARLDNLVIKACMRSTMSRLAEWLSGNDIRRLHMRWSLVALAAFAIAGGYAVSRGVGAERAQVAHGKYLVQLGGCTDCHTPGHLL